MKDSRDSVEEESKTLTVQQGVIGELNIKTHPQMQHMALLKIPLSPLNRSGALVSPITADHEDSLVLQLM